jgi:hypothetical protein
MKKQVEDWIKLADKDMYAAELLIEDTLNQDIPANWD